MNTILNSTLTREDILDRVRAYHAITHPEKPFSPGATRLAVSDSQLSSTDICSLVDVALSGWVTASRRVDELERRLAERLGVKYAVMVNSGSSANLLATTALMEKDFGSGSLAAGTEVIIPAVGFPTTLNPIIQCGMLPVLVDVEPGTWNPSAAAIAAAVTYRTSAIVVGHTLGNPCDMEAIVKIANRHRLVIFEDCCDAFGTTVGGKPVGSFGVTATLSFYPAHHITAGEGGAVLTDGEGIARTVRSLRDWGRACWCKAGQDGCCGKRFDWMYDSLPLGFDHKYTFRHIGYNMRPTEMQGALGLSQLNRLDEFLAARRRNYAILRERLSDLEELMVLPRVIAGADPAWFGFPICLTASARPRRDVVQALESLNIGTRMLMGGNLARQPAYQNAAMLMRYSLANADAVTERGFWVGLHQYLGEREMNYIADCIRKVVVP